MCGIVGFLDLKHLSLSEDFRSVLTRMMDPIYHRGPDDSGLWVCPENGIALGHRRLSIIDLSLEGHQPMHSASGRYVVVFNGEIYNYKCIRQELDGNYRIDWRGHSDTEILLAAIEEWGLVKAVKSFIGMFAFVLWDRQERKLHLVRDRLGEKPLYYGWLGDVFLFGSELKSLKLHPVWRGEVNRDALTLLMRHNYIPTPYSIYKGIYKLLPGTILTLDTSTRGKTAEPVPFWSVKSVAEAGVYDQFSVHESEIIDRLDTLLKESISQQMVADVPLGAFLSGGIDSSTVVALMQAQSSRPVKTFTIGFDDEGYNEAEHAKTVARHLGTEHTEIYVSPDDALNVIPKLPSLYDEPFSDSSQIPTYLVSQLTKKHVAVSLSGDGGDELFGGYNRYFWGRSIWKGIGWMPKPLRCLGGKGLTVLSPQVWDALFHKLGSLLPHNVRQRNPGDKLHKLGDVLAVDTPEEMYHRLVSYWQQPASLVLGATEPQTVLTDRTQWADLSDFTQRMMYLDMVSYLPDDILVKVDRAAMGVSLETRIPFLDHRIVEFAWRVPLSMKVRDGQGKWLLRQVLYRYVPSELVERPKTGFGIPIDSWLRDPLREWAEGLLDERRLREEGFFDPVLIQNKWKEHLSGKRNWQYHLWDVLMFQAWLENESN
jgi:asparagine synthase (glutamine-hydrolysing)